MNFFIFYVLSVFIGEWISLTRPNLFPNMQIILHVHKSGCLLCKMFYMLTGMTSGTRRILLFSRYFATSVKKVF